MLLGSVLCYCVLLLLCFCFFIFLLVVVSRLLFKIYRVVAILIFAFLLAFLFYTVLNIVKYYETTGQKSFWCSFLLLFCFVFLLSFLSLPSFLFLPFSFFFLSLSSSSSVHPFLSSAVCV